MCNKEAELSLPKQSGSHEDAAEAPGSQLFAERLTYQMCCELRVIV